MNVLLVRPDGIGDERRLNAKRVPMDKRSRDSYMLDVQQIADNQMHKQFLLLQGREQPVLRVGEGQVDVLLFCRIRREARRGRKSWRTLRCTVRAEA